MAPTDPWRERLVDWTVGSAGSACAVAPEPVGFGRRGWLAQHRWLEPTVGLAALLALGVLYLAARTVVPGSGVVFPVVWALFLAGAAVLWFRRPCTVLRLPVHALLVWLALVASAGWWATTP